MNGTTDRSRALPQRRAPCRRPAAPPRTGSAILKAVGDLIAEQGAPRARRSTRSRPGRASRAGPSTAAGPTATRCSPPRCGTWRGREPPSPSGTTSRRTCGRHVEEARAVLDEPSFRAMLPALAEIQLSDERDEVVRSLVFPQRDGDGADVPASSPAAAGFRTDIPPKLPNDILVGALLYRLLYSGGSPTRARRRRWSTSCSTGSGFAIRARSSLVPARLVACTTMRRCTSSPSSRPWSRP